MANPTTYTGHLESRIAATGMVGGGDGVSTYDEISAFNDTTGANWSGNLAHEGWSPSVNGLHWGLGELGNVLSPPVIQGVHPYKIGPAINQANFAMLAVMRGSRGRNAGQDACFFELTVGGSAPCIGLGLGLNNILRGWVTKTADTVRTKFTMIGSGSYTGPCYLPVTPIPLTYDVTDDGTHYVMSVRAYGYPGVLSNQTSDKTAVLNGAATFRYIGNDATANVGLHRGGVDELRWYSQPLSTNDWNDYKSTYMSSSGLAARLHPLNPRHVIIHIGTSITDGFFSFADVNTVSLTAHAMLSNTVQYNWGYAGVDAATLALNASTYAADITNLRLLWPGATIVVVLECGANDAGADGRGSGWPTDVDYNASLATLVTQLRLAGARKVYKRTSIPMGKQGVAGQARIDSYNVKDRLSSSYDGVIDIARDPNFVLADSTLGTLNAMTAGPMFYTGSATDATPTSADFDRIHPGLPGHRVMATALTRELKWRLNNRLLTLLD